MAAQIKTEADRQEKTDEKIVKLFNELAFAIQEQKAVATNNAHTEAQMKTLIN